MKTFAIFFVPPFDKNGNDFFLLIRHEMKGTFYIFKVILPAIFFSWIAFMNEMNVLKQDKKAIML